MDVQVQNAIEIAWNPSSDPILKSQAFEFLTQLRQNSEAWQICLSLFTHEPSKPEVVRHFALEVLNNAVQAQDLSVPSLSFLKDSLLEYVRRQYGDLGRRRESPGVQNKVAQCLTSLFVMMYDSSWPTFFEDFLQLAESQLRSGSIDSPASLLYLRILVSVHDEIADLLVANSLENQKRYTELKDHIRARDATRIAQSWQEILSRWQQLDAILVEICLKTISRWVTWTDISLIVNEALMDVVFRIAVQPEATARDNPSSKVRDAAIDVFTEIVGKKMKSVEKIELMRFLNLDSVIKQLISTPSLSNSRGTSIYDTDMAETVAKLVNNVVYDIVKVLDTEPPQAESSISAGNLLEIFVEHLLRFFADEYDEICSTVIPSLTDLLTYLRKLAKSKGSVPDRFAAMLPRILDAIVSKMRYDDTSGWGEEDDETDEAEFQELRKRLKVLQQIVAAIDETMFLDKLGSLISDTLTKLRSQGSELNWRDVELSLNELFLLGELGVKNGGLYQKKAPSSAAASRLIQLMSAMLESGAPKYPHPATTLQYMELCVRYVSFFEQQPQYIPQVLENFVDFVHSPHSKIRMRSWHLFLRYVRHLRSQLGNVSHMVVEAISDLLIINAEVQEESGTDDVSSDQKSQSANAVFNSQLYLFEAIGTIASSSSVSIENQLSLAQTVIRPLLSGIEQNLTPAMNGNEQSILQIHHLIKAAGTLAQGFSEWVPGASGTKVPVLVSDEFLKASETILAAVESLKSSLNIREAARSTFSRMIGVLGFKILQQLPRWIDGLLSESSSKDEMAIFLRLMDQVIFGFKTEISDTLDLLLTPLLQRIFSGFAEQTTGTDDEIQLGELRREYLGFLLAILSNDLASVFVSSTNQGIFDSIVSTIEHFAKDTSDHPDARLALSVLTRMSLVWGGPDIPASLRHSTTPSPTLPAFDTFMLTRFSSLTWTLMTNPLLNPKEPQANRLIGEIAILQQTILLKTGAAYLTWLRDTELRNMGAQEPTINDYLVALTSKDAKSFKAYLLNFIQRSRG